MLVTLVGMAAVSRTAWAEEPAPSRKRDLSLSGKPAVGSLLPDLEAVTKDAEQVIREREARERAEKAVRESLPTPARRPDLTPDVWGGIQSRRLKDVLRDR